jgi:hypothetical protein
MRPNRLRQIWQEGGAAVNGWLQLPHGFAAEVMAAQGWDSLTIDMQHGPVGYDTALTMLQAMSASDVTPLARVPWNEPGIIMKMLDAGCYGIICPMVNSAEEAKRFVGACRYPPKGYRSFGPTRGPPPAASRRGDRRVRPRRALGPLPLTAPTTAHRHRASTGSHRLRRRPGHVTSIVEDSGLDSSDKWSGSSSHLPRNGPVAPCWLRGH